jgi:hypothetical protein
LGKHNKKFVPYLRTINRILISAMNRWRWMGLTRRVRPGGRGMTLFPSLVPYLARRVHLDPYLMIGSSSQQWIVGACSQEHGRQLLMFGLEPASVPSYAELWRTVAPPDQQEVDAVLLLG